MSEILADACAQGERIAHGRVHVRCALLVDKTIVDEIGGGLGEASHGAVAAGLGGFRNFGDLGKIGNVGARSEPVKVFFEKIGANGVEARERHTAGFGDGSFVHQNDGFGFDSQAAMGSKDAGDVDPVSVAVLVGRAARSRTGDEAEGKTALAVVVNGAKPDLVVTLVDGAVVDEFSGVEQMEAVHATPA